MKARIKWELEFDYPLFDTDLEHAQFYLEENHCQENLLDYLVSESENGICKLCSIGKVTLIELKED